MKQIILSLVAICSTFAAQAQSCVTIQQVGTDYTSHQITIALTRNGCTGDATGHRNTVWVFVDYREAGGSSWTRATVSAASAGTVINSGSSKGVWIYGDNGTQTVMLTLGDMPAKYDWCALATDYPPNAAGYNNGSYTLKGTAPFTINGNITATGNTSGETINTITDATGCPGCMGRDVLHGGGTCCEGLTPVGGYCRNLTADDAYHCSSGDVEVSRTLATTCPSGWAHPTQSQSAACCRQTLNMGLKGTNPAAWWLYGNDYLPAYASSVNTYHASTCCVPQSHVNERCPVTIPGWRFDNSPIWVNVCVR